MRKYYQKFSKIYKNMQLIPCIWTLCPSNFPSFTRRVGQRNRTFLCRLGCVTKTSITLLPFSPPIFCSQRIVNVKMVKKDTTSDESADAKMEQNHEV